MDIGLYIVRYGSMEAVYNKQHNAEKDARGRLDLSLSSSVTPLFTKLSALPAAPLSRWRCGVEQCRHMKLLPSLGNTLLET